MENYVFFVYITLIDLFTDNGVLEMCADNPNDKPAKGLLKFQEGVIVFSSAIMGALFIGWPNLSSTDRVPVGLYEDLLQHLAITVALAMLAAFVTHLSWSTINRGQMPRTPEEGSCVAYCAAYGLTIMAMVPGILAVFKLWFPG